MYQFEVKNYEILINSIYLRRMATFPHIYTTTNCYSETPQYHILEKFSNTSNYNPAYASCPNYTVFYPTYAIATCSASRFLFVARTDISNSYIGNIFVLGWTTANTAFFPNQVVEPFGYFPVSRLCGTLFTTIYHFEIFGDFVRRFMRLNEFKFEWCNWVNYLIGWLKFSPIGHIEYLIRIY